MCVFKVYTKVNLYPQCVYQGQCVLCSPMCIPGVCVSLMCNPKSTCVPNVYTKVNECPQRAYPETNVCPQYVYQGQCVSPFPNWYSKVNVCPHVYTKANVYPLCVYQGQCVSQCIYQGWYVFLMYKPMSMCVPNVYTKVSVCLHCV